MLILHFLLLQILFLNFLPLQMQHLQLLHRLRLGEKQTQQLYPQSQQRGALKELEGTLVIGAIGENALVSAIGARIAAAIKLCFAILRFISITVFRIVYLVLRKECNELSIDKGSS